MGIITNYANEWFDDSPIFSHGQINYGQEEQLREKIEEMVFDAVQAGVDLKKYVENGFLDLDAVHKALRSLTNPASVKLKSLKEKVKTIRDQWLRTTDDTYDKRGYANPYGGPHTREARAARDCCRADLRKLGFNDPGVLSAITSIKIIGNQVFWDPSKPDLPANVPYGEHIRVIIPDDISTPPSPRRAHPKAVLEASASADARTRIALENGLRKVIANMVAAGTPVNPAAFAAEGPWAPDFVRRYLAELGAQGSHSFATDVVVEDADAALDQAPWDLLSKSSAGDFD